MFTPVRVTSMGTQIPTVEDIPAADSVGGFGSVTFQAQWNDYGDSCGTSFSGLEQVKPSEVVFWIGLWALDIMVFPLSQRRDDESQLKSGKYGAWRQRH